MFVNIGYLKEHATIDHFGNKFPNPHVDYYENKWHPVSVCVNSLPTIYIYHVDYYVHQFWIH